MAETPALHILLVSFAAQGNINPLLRFGKRLASKILRVTYATTEVARKRMLEANTNNLNSNPSSNIQVEFFSDGWDLDVDRYKDIDAYTDQLSRAGPKNLSLLVKTLADNCYPVSCIVISPFVPWVIDVAEEHGIPCAMLWIQSCSLFAFQYRYFLGSEKFPDPATDDDFVIDFLPWLPSLHKEDLPSSFFPSHPFSSYRKLQLELFHKLNRINWVFGNSFHELERKAIESLEGLQTIKCVGPLVPSELLGKDDESYGPIGGDMWKPAMECLDWLDTKPESSVVYVAFGSFFGLSNKQMENIAWGLKNSGRFFLWVVKPPENTADKGGELPAGFLDEISGQGLVVNWGPQVKVLSHPSVACFLTHCGWNSIMETIAAGVPVIAFPQVVDQNTNAKLLVDVFKVGLRLRRDGEDGIVTRKEVERCVVEATEGHVFEGLRMRAIKLKGAVREATREGGPADLNIEIFVDELAHYNKM